MWDLSVPGNNDHDFKVLATGPFRMTDPAVLVHNINEVSCPSFNAARRAAFRDNNVPTSQANNYSVGESSGGPFTPNMRGPYGELPQSIYTQDLDGIRSRSRTMSGVTCSMTPARRWDLT
jgi:hypothetical protein